MSIYRCAECECLCDSDYNCDEHPKTGECICECCASNLEYGDENIYPDTTPPAQQAFVYALDY